MTSVKIIKHALLMLWYNRLDVARLALLPMGLLWVGRYMMSSIDNPLFGIGLLFVFIGLMWFFVDWQRYVLLEEYPKNWYAVPRIKIMIPSFLRGVLVVLILSALIPPLIFMLETKTTGVLFSLVSIVVFAIFLAFLIIGYRLSLCMVAEAIGHDATVETIWKKSKRLELQTIGIAIISGIFFVVEQVILKWLEGAFPTVAWSVFPIGTMCLWMVHSSILATLYGVFVEGRKIKK